LRSSGDLWGRVPLSSARGFASAHCLWQAIALDRSAEHRTAVAVNVETLQAQWLSLSKANRSRLLERLIASLDVDPAAEDAWERLAEARDAELDSGAARPIAIEDAMARLRA
jgi:hypothetical protein